MLVSRAKAVRKNHSVSGRPAGWLKMVLLETFFFFIIFAKKMFFFPIMDNIFMEKKKWKKKKKKLLASILATRCTGNRYFFMDSLMTQNCSRR